MKTTDKINGILIDYYANINIPNTLLFQVGVSKKNLNETREIMALSQREWEAIPCDPEGATPEQERMLDQVLDNTTKQILKLIQKIW
uniref:Uncharacterized protein n=1 Tax=viral metagenome TaxID=1070528 RepID=A0A6H2A4P5_9ZZZZ